MASYTIRLSLNITAVMTETQNIENNTVIVFLRPYLSEQKPAGRGAIVFVIAKSEVSKEFMSDFSHTRPYFVDIVSFMILVSNV